jgi:hypothetical protein
MTSEIRAESGQGWARSAVGIGAVLSVAGNITHTVLTPSAVHLAIRIPMAAALPVILFIAVEVFVRVAWRRTLLDFIGRATLILLPAFGAGYVSYFHLRDLAALSGEDAIGRVAWPLSVDGLMLGGTIALLAIRAARIAEQIKPAAVIPIEAEITEQATVPLALEPEAVSEPEALERVTQPRAERAPRGQVSENMRAAVLALVDADNPLSVKDAAEKHDVARSTLGRYGTVLALLRDDPQRDLPDALAGRVKPELVGIIRDAANRGRAR